MSCWIQVAKCQEIVRRRQHTLNTLKDSFYNRPIALINAKNNYIYIYNKVQ